MSDGTWQPTESGLLVKIDENLKRYVQFAAIVDGVLVRAKSDFPDLDAATAWLNTVRQDRADPHMYSENSKLWYTFTDPIVGEASVYDGSFIDAIFSIGYDWVDIEEEQAKQIIRRKESLALKAAAGRMDRNGRR